VMGLEPIRRLTHAPQTCLSAYSSTLAYILFPDCFNIIADKKRFVNPFFEKNRNFLKKIFQTQKRMRKTDKKRTPKSPFRGEEVVIFMLQEAQV